MPQENDCPYYGHYHHRTGILLPQLGNQCPFKQGYAPCHMKIKGNRPNWYACRHNTKKKLQITDARSKLKIIQMIMAEMN